VLAGVLGVSLGVALLFLTKRASRLMTPEDPAVGMAKVLATVGAGLALAVASLAILYLYARPALAPFGLSLAAGFLVVAFVELFRFGGVAAVSGRRR
jgi:hypothetical protein